MRLRGERERAVVGSEGLRQRLSESSVAIQMQGGCVSAHAGVIGTFQAPAICLELCECSVASRISARQ